MPRPASNLPDYWQYQAGGMASEGEASVLLLQVDFPDKRFAEGDTLEALEDIAFGGRNVDYPYESLSAYYDRASYGKLQIRGQAFAYTASHERSWYESNGIQSLFQETLAALDEEIDYTQFDGNGDGWNRWGLSALCRGAYRLGKYLVEHDLRKTGQDHPMTACRWAVT